ncbi:MAG: glycosyltransferase [Flavobacteriaceae bacterium]|nr:glycosyltransferase [Flavobacteriaceae bacterium]
MDVKTKSLLIIGLVWPEPNSTAAGTRMLQLIHFFKQQEYEITFACAASESDNSLDLTALGIVKKEIALNCDSFNNFVATLKPTVVLFDRFLIEEQYGWRVAEYCPTALRILDTEDLHFLRIARHTAFKKGVLLQDEHLFSQDATREIASLYRCDLSLIISSFEMDLLKNRFNIDDSLLFYLPFLNESLQENSLSSFPSFEDRSDFMTIGNFRHAPNWQSILYLKQVIWPLIRKKSPKSVLHIYGSYVTPKARQLHNPKEGFLVEGFVLDSNSAFRKAKVCLSPLQFGAGLKGKLFDAMLHGTPSVTSSIGAEGMHDTLPWNGSISDSPDDFATQAVHLIQNKESWEVAQKNGLKIINTLFNKELFYTLFSTALQSLLEHKDKHRLKNFIGAMLQYHTLKSTKYFSQWIAEKNR